MLMDKEMRDEKRREIAEVWDKLQKIREEHIRIMCCKMLWWDRFADINAVDMMAICRTGKAKKFHDVAVAFTRSPEIVTASGKMLGKCREILTGVFGYYEGVARLRCAKGKI